MGDRRRQQRWPVVDDLDGDVVAGIAGQELLRRRGRRRRRRRVDRVVERRDRAEALDAEDEFLAVEQTDADEAGAGAVAGVLTENRLEGVRRGLRARRAG